MLDFALYMGSAILLGIALSTIIETITNKVWCPSDTAENFNTISDKYIRECICFEPDSGRSIDDLAVNLKDEDVNFSVGW